MRPNEGEALAARRRELERYERAIEELTKLHASIPGAIDGLKVAIGLVRTQIGHESLPELPPPADAVDPHVGGSSE